MAKAFWKLVRDKIPAIIEKDGTRPEIRTLDDKAYRSALVKKLDEEVKELKDALASDNNEHIIDEMADVLEVMSCLAHERNIDTNILFAAANKKRSERGSFLSAVQLKITK